MRTRAEGDVIGWLVDGLIGWWVHWLIGWLVDWLIGWLVDWSIDRSIDRWIDPNHRFDAERSRVLSRRVRENWAAVWTSFGLLARSLVVQKLHLPAAFKGRFVPLAALSYAAIPSWQVVSSLSCVPTFSWRLSAGEPCLMTYYSLW